MDRPLSNVNDFLNSKKLIPIKEENVVISGADATKNIFINEVSKINKLENLSNELIKYIADEKSIKQLTYSQKQELLKTISIIQSDSRNFIFKMAELASKNEFLKKMIEINEAPKQIIESNNGETYISSIDDDTRRDLTELLRDVVNNRCYDQ